MKTNPIRNIKFALLLAVSTGFISHSVRAQETYLVTIDTASLANTAVAANAPFSLDLQMNYGSGPFGNSAVVSDVNFNGGGTLAAANLSGTAAGDLNSVVTLSDNSANAFNDFNQAFAPGATLSFDVTLSNDTTINTPDGFIVGILDQTGYQIPTTDPDGVTNPPIDGTDLVDFDIGGQGLVDQQIYVTTYEGANNPTYGGDYTGVTVTVQAVPEPSSWALAAIAGSVFLLVLRCRNRA